MMKKTKPFREMTTDEYYDFVWSYTTFDKTKEQLIKDLEITNEELPYLDEALEYLKSREEIHKKEGLPSPSYAYYLIEYLEDEVDKGVPEDIVEEIEKALAENNKENLGKAVERAFGISEEE